MKKLPEKYIIVEIIPTNSLASKGFIAQLQALKIENDKIIERMDLRVHDTLIKNNDLLNMISYDKDMFKYTDNLLDEDGEFNIYASRFLGIEDGEIQIGDIESDDEWALLDDVLEEARKGLEKEA